LPLIKIAPLDQEADMLIRVTTAEGVGPFSLRLTFNDGTSKRVNLRRWLNGPVFEPAASQPARSL
jgi:hypothetical protein